jgi:chloramphenicol O-acetyltransferase type A
MPQEIEPKDTTRAAAYALWMKAPNPMVTFLKTLDVTNLVRLGARRHLKFNMLLDYCIGRAAAPIREFYMLPVDGRLMQYDALAVNTIVKNHAGGLSSCDILFSDDLETFNREYLAHTSQTAESCQDRDLSADCMVIGTSAIVETELDGAVGMNSGIYHNPFLIWGRYRRKLFRYALPISFQFHHTQMDGGHAGRFLENLQDEINKLGKR